MTNRTTGRSARFRNLNSLSSLGGWGVKPLPTSGGIVESLVEWFFTDNWFIDWNKDRVMVRMLDDKVAIIPVKDPAKYGTIIIPDSVREGKRPDQGIVYAIGPNVKDVTIGDHVLFSPYSGSKITIVDVGVLHVMPESSIECWFDDESEEPIFPLSLVVDLVRQATDQHAIATNGDIETLAPIRQRIIDEFKNYPLTRGLEY